MTTGGKNHFWKVCCREYGGNEIDAETLEVLRTNTAVGGLLSTAV